MRGRERERGRNRKLENETEFWIPLEFEMLHSPPLILLRAMRAQKRRKQSVQPTIRRERASMEGTTLGFEH